MSDSNVLPIPKWETGIPSKLVDYVVGEYQEDFEFLKYDFNLKQWEVYQNGGWRICIEDVVRWHYLALSGINE